MDMPHPYSLVGLIGADKAGAHRFDVVVVVVVGRGGGRGERYVPSARLDPFFPHCEFRLERHTISYILWDSDMDMPHRLKYQNGLVF